MLLLAHPASPPGPVRRFEAQAGSGSDGLIRLSYRLDADVPQLRIPAGATPARADGLWRHTCFEAFIVAPGSPAYCELNFSPSGEWAAYSFTGYRAGMTPLDLPAAPVMRWRRDARQLQLDVALSTDGLPRRGGAGPVRLALAAVVEAQSGTITYWALRHPEGQPDFHHPDGFVLELDGSESGATKVPRKS